MKIRKAHCLFEQSGTFKNEFIKLGIPAEDYDIQNEFGQTDHIIDLFSQIRGGYNGEPSIFDDMEPDDLVIAFFPCTRFEDQIALWFRGHCHSQRTWSDEQKMLRCMELQSELSNNYMLVNQMFLLARKKGIRLIMENPYSEQHYLRRYWCMAPSLIDKDRSERGDYFNKPTQYWFVNCKPENNIIFEIVNDNSCTEKDVFKYTKRARASLGLSHIKEETFRSLIHPDYANRFIREFILDE